MGKTACRSALYQEQKGKLRLEAYYSKKLPDTESRYSISKLELYMVWLPRFQHLNMCSEINILLYILTIQALVPTMKAKSEPSTLRSQN